MPHIFKLLSKLEAVPFSEALNHCDVNEKNEGIPLLHYVIRNAGPRHLESLLRHNVDVNALADEGTLTPGTALQWITGMMGPDVYMFGHVYNYSSHKGKLWSLGARQQELDTYVGTADEIMHAIANSLIEKGAQVDFFSLCALGDLERVRQLLEQDPQLVNKIGPDGSTPLAWAARRDQKEVVKFLLQAGADINHVNFDGFTAFEQGIRYHGSNELMSIMLQQGAWVRQGIIGLCIKEKVEKLDYLLSQCHAPGALVTFNDLKEIEPYVYYEDYLKIFAKHSISLTKIDEELWSKQETPLILRACRGPAPSFIRLVISLGANVNATFPEQYSGAPEYIDANPLVFLYFSMQRALKNKSGYYFKTQLIGEKEKHLLSMAILFAHGSLAQPKHDIQPHPLDSLELDDLLNFLIVLADEFKSQPELFSQLPAESIQYLNKKINEIRNNNGLTHLNENSQKQIIGLMQCSSYPQFLKEEGINPETLSAANVAGAIKHHGKNELEVNTLKYSFMIWAREHDCKVGEDELAACLDKYQGHSV